MYKSFCYNPITTLGSFGTPTMHGIHTLGTSSPANPIFITPLPLSIMIAFFYSDINYLI